MSDEPSGISGELPELPPGYGWRVDERGVGTACTVTQGDDALWWGYSLDDAAYMAERAHDLHDHLLRAAIAAAAAEAGVVLPEGYDVGAVLRDGVRAHGWWWQAVRGAVVLRRGHGDPQGVAMDNGRWWHSVPHTHLAGDDTDAAARALWDAVGPAGLPMPPLPGAT